jgi:hypothetical protein
MAALVIRSWFDDSERDDEKHSVSSVAGCVGTDAQWQAFERAWATDVLQRFNLDYMHMKEVKSGAGKFAKFKDEREAEELAKAIISAISNSGIHPFGAVARTRDLRRFNRSHSLPLNGYSLNIYACMRLIRQIYGEGKLAPADHVEMILDRIAKPEQAIATAKAYAATNDIFPDLADFVLPVALPKNNLARNVFPLQAADFVAWECRKNVEDYDGCFERREDGKRGRQYDALADSNGRRRIIYEVRSIGAAWSCLCCGLEPFFGAGLMIC